MTPDEFMQAYIAASDADDLNAVGAMIHPEAVYFFSNKTSLIGKDAVLAAIAKNFESIKDGSYRVSNLEWLHSNNESATCIYDYHWYGVIGGEAMSGYGRGSGTIVRDGESWLVIHEHLSAGRFREE